MSVLVVDHNRHMLNLNSEILGGIGIRDLILLTDPAAGFREIEIMAVAVVVTDQTRAEFDAR